MELPIDQAETTYHFINEDVAVLVLDHFIRAAVAPINRDVVITRVACVGGLATLDADFDQAILVHSAVVQPALKVRVHFPDVIDRIQAHSRIGIVTVAIISPTPIMVPRVW